MIKTQAPGDSGTGTIAQRQRIPMSLPRQRLSVPDIPGYHLHWMSGTKQRIAAALAAGYEFVDPSEADVAEASIGSQVDTTGSTDLGSRVSVSAGADIGPDGTEVRLYLMKIRQEFWDQDQSVLAERNEQIAASIRGGQNPNEANPHGSENRYVPEASRRVMADLFTPKRRRA